jgi:hypothetical protein
MNIRQAGIIAFVFTAAAAQAEPQASLSTSQGYPQVSMASASCPQTGVNSATRQEIIDEAAKQWSLFRFPRFALTNVAAYNVLPPGISPDERRSKADGAFVPRVLPVGYFEDDKEVRKLIGNYWASVSDYADIYKHQNEIWKSSDGKAGWAQYWSAAFVSYVMCMAGLTDNEFKRNSAHVEYIRPAVEQRDGRVSGYGYTAYDLKETTPAPGDLMCAAREDEERKINDLASFKANLGHASYHCDIVVGFDVTQPKEAGVVYAIGGNVINAVSLTEAPISKGTVTKVLTPSGRNWFTILKLASNAGSADFRKVPPAIIESAEKIAKARLRDAPSNPASNLVARD